MITAARVASARLLAWLRKEQLDRDFEEEIAAHLEMAAEEAQRRGLNAEQARREARIRLGGHDAVRELHRDTRGLPWLDELQQDLRYALRLLRRDLGFTIVAILILGIGIGANTAVFSLVNAVLLRPLPFRDPGRLVWIANHYPGNETHGLSGESTRVAVLEEWQRRSRSFTGLSAYNPFFAYGSRKLTGAGGEPERLIDVMVARDFFPLLGVRPHLGRFFIDAECRRDGPRAVVLSHGLWQRRFGADPGIVGRAITLDEEPTVVVGIMPQVFDFASVFSPGSQVDLFLPLPYDVAKDWGNTLGVVGRLRNGATVASAQSELDAITRQLYKDRPDLGIHHGAAVEPLADHVRGRTRLALIVLWCAVGTMLLIVCANLANLFLSRAISRHNELALRAALGARRGRLVRQLLTECLVLAAGGAALGLALAYGTIRYVANVPAMKIPLLQSAGLDASALSFTVLVAMAAGILFGIAPALQVSGTDLHAALDATSRSSGGRRQSWLRSVLVVAQTALACVLLVAAGLLLRSFLRVLDTHLGFRPQRVFALKISPNPALTEEWQLEAFFAEVVRRAQAVPGVESAGITDTLPLDGNRSWGVRAKGVTYPPDSIPSAYVRRVSPGYFETMGIPLRAGRDFSAQDTSAVAPVLIVNETMARALWPGANAVEQTATIGKIELRVVGVVGDVRHSSLEEEAGLEMYLPIFQADAPSADLVIRTRLSPPALAASLRRAMRPLDPTLPLSDLRPLEQFVDRAVSPRRFFASLMTAFAAVALTLAALGIYGVIAYSVGQRTHEIGIRMALGATTGSVLLGVLSRTLGLALAGVLIGTAGAAAVSRVMSSLLFGISTFDPLTFGGMTAVLTLAAILAGYLPARRAARLNPLLALRSA